ncbi:MAG: hypoxanthine phosphoribosyltransferase [Desulfuromonadaceae bacterium]|nr:hypoxanthine phosphoribosyltransferase [Desulfuromonas sp.]MDY0186065.1 hypoxanthine phosphoribosyltransferase [Desulfuromonadaceae bacterium]
MELLFSKERIATRVAQLGAAISQDYANTEIVAIVILKGAFMFAADLLRHINVPVTLEFMQIASYHNGTCSSGEVEIILDLHNDIAGKHVIVIEDILDSGRTLKALQSLLAKCNPASVKLCTLLDKRERREVKIEADYVGMEIEDRFTVGYGLDHNGRYRQLEQIYVI